MNNEPKEGALIQAAQIIVREVGANPALPYERQFKGRGIVTCAGGCTYFTNAWILIKMLRHCGCKLPIELWHFGEEEMDAKMRQIISDLDVQCRDVSPFCLTSSRTGWALKTVAIARSSFEEVLYLDADNVAAQDPSFLFDIPQYEETGALFWPGTRLLSDKHPFWQVFGLMPVDEPEVETGQMVINKRTRWKPLMFADQLSLRSDVFHQFQCGGKELFRFVCRKLGQDYAMPQSPPQMLTTGEVVDAVLCQQTFSGERLFQHRLFRKWDLLAPNPWVSGFFFESQCHVFIEELKKRWDGRCGSRQHRVKSANLLRCKESLISNCWRLELSGSAQELLPQPTPEPSPANSKGDFPDFVKPPPDLSKVNIEGRTTDVSLISGRFHDPHPSTREIVFARNGTLKKGASPETGCFWDLNELPKQMQLLLSSDNHELISLTRVSVDCWKGRCVDGPMAGRDAVLSTVQKRYPHLVNTSKDHSGQGGRREIVRSVGKQIRVACSGADLGDHILAVYACAGLSRSGVRVTFHTPRAEWLSRATEPGLIISRKERKNCRDVNYDPECQMRYGLSRASWYASALHPLLKPVKPAVNTKPGARRFPFDKYILFKPCSENRAKMWPESHWTRLANLLRGQAYEMVAFGTKDQAGSLLRTFSQTQTYWVVGQTPEWIMDALLGAAAYVGIDDGITHLSALLGVKTVAIHSQLPASFLWGPAEVESVTPNTACALCRFQDDRGYLESCEVGCSALATISPETVLKRLLKLLDKE
ncbi:MAG: glycosyltransferase family 9 protein [Limisphaerales bacterium]